MEKRKVVVVGGGITGLSAAYFLQKQVREQALPIEVKLIEAGNRLGGVVQTVRKDGYIIERGPDSIISTKKSGLRLIEEVGLKDEVIYNTAGKSFILANGKLHSIPEGSYMGIPTRISPFVISGLFTMKGKLRAAGDFILPKGEKKADQSLGGFFRRRLGNEVVENLIEPLLAGIYTGDIDDLSLMALFPNFYEMEQTYRSLVFGLKRTLPKPPKKAKKQPTRKGMFISLKSGLETLVDALEDRMEPGSVLKGEGVAKISRLEGQYECRLTNGWLVKADSVVIATDHFHARQMLSDYPFMDVFKQMPSNSIANVALAFPKSAVKQDIEGTGFVVSRNSDCRITACTWTHKKWPTSTPVGKVLLRCFIGKPNDQEVVDLSDEEIIQIVLDDLNKTMNITEKPEFHVISRWKNTMPQYSVGHLGRMEGVKSALLSQMPGVFLAGGSYEGVGVPGCIDQGEAAGNNVLQFLSKQPVSGS